MAVRLLWGPATIPPHLPLAPQTHTHQDLRVPLLVLYGSEASLCSEEVADVPGRGPCQESVEHSLTDLEGRLLTVNESLSSGTRLCLRWVITNVGARVRS